MAYYFIDDISVIEIPKFDIHELEVNEHVILKNIYFETNKYAFLKASYKELEKLYNLLNENPNVSIKLEGHTDNVGNDTYNLALSRRRAAAVVNFLENKGVDGRQLESRGFGESRPIESNSSPGGRQLNRRVEINLLDTDRN